MNPIETEELDDMERELAMLSPKPASGGLRDRIAMKLDAAAEGERCEAATDWTRWYAPLALAASVAITAMLLALFTPRDRVEVVPEGSRHTAVWTEMDAAQPSMLAYHRAYLQSDDQLDELLDAHAAAHHSAALLRKPESPMQWHQPLQEPSRMKQEDRS